MLLRLQSLDLLESIYLCTGLRLSQHLHQLSACRSGQIWGFLEESQGVENGLPIPLLSYLEFRNRCCPPLMYGVGYLKISIVFYKFVEYFRVISRIHYLFYFFFLLVCSFLHCFLSQCLFFSLFLHSTVGYSGSDGDPAFFHSHHARQLFLIAS